jgi:hypothetical protein
MVTISGGMPILLHVGSKRKSVVASIASMPGRQIAMFMKGSDNLNGTIKSAGFFLREHSGLPGGLRGDARSPFRVRVFARDSTTGKPGKELIDDVIITSALRRNEWHEVDLSSYQVTAPKEGFFVCFSLLPQAFYQFFGSKSRKVGFHHNFGVPYLGVTRHREFKEALSYDYESYNGNWRLNSFIGNFMMRAKVLAY